MKKQIFILLLLLVAMTSCEEEEEPSYGHPKGNYPATSFTQIQLSEVSPYEPGAPAVTTTQTYLFYNGLLTDYTTLQNYTVVNEKVEIKNRTTISYNDREVTVTDDAGNVSTYTLNDDGYAVKCIRQETGTTRTYTFSYLVNTENEYYLENITESINEGKVYASIEIDYNNNRALRITQKVDAYEQIYTATTPADNEIANLSQIPCLFLTELYPLNLHSAALYGKLLGEPFPALITEIIPDGNAESNETVSYTYQTNAQGIVTSCTEVTNSYGTKYDRILNYVIQ